MRHCWPRCEPTISKSSSCGGRRLAKFSPTHADSEVLDVFIVIAEHRRRQGNAQHCSALFPRTICTSVLSAAKERRKLTKPKRAPMTGAGRKRLRKAKTKQDMLRRSRAPQALIKTATCFACQAWKLVVHAARCHQALRTLTYCLFFFDCRKLKETVGRRLSARVEREQKIITEKQP